MQTVLGIDAGGTKTLGALIDQEGNLVDLIVGRGLDPIETDDHAADISAFIANALESQSKRPVAATIGLPYHGEVPSITRLQIDTAHAELGETARVANDVEIAHLGAFAGGEGILCLAGTGSMAWASGPNGMSRSGGYGDIYSDEGSAYWIGQKTLTLVSRESDGRRQPSAFGAALLERLGTSMEGLVDWTYGHENRRSGVASISRHVSELAAEGHQAAGEILQSAAAEIADLGAAAGRSAGLPEGASWSYAGSVFLDPIIRAEVSNRLGSQPKKSKLPPVGGALVDAARRAGWTVDDALIQKIANNLASATPRPV